REPTSGGQVRVAVQRDAAIPEETSMKLNVLAISTMALMCAVGTASAQSATSTAGGAGMLCSELTAMDSTSQTAFLQGYRAGRQDAMESGAGDMAASGSAAGGASASGSAAGGSAAAGSAAGGA